MGLLRLIARLFGLTTGDEQQAANGSGDVASMAGTVGVAEQARAKPAGVREGRQLRRPLRKLRYESSLVQTPDTVEVVEFEPYEFARFGPFQGTYRNLSLDGDQGWLEEFGLPDLATPKDLADWLGVSLNDLAWLANRCDTDGVPKSLKAWHYVSQWHTKRDGTLRLIESPKPRLKEVQKKILSGILNHIPAHRAAHGFVKGRSAITNADRHAGAAVVYKTDLGNFYGTIGLSRVVAIFRTVGFNREVAMWLGRLVTSHPPYDFRPPRGQSYLASEWRRRHLPQGAPTSPAIANLSAYALDVRLSGLASSYKAFYTRYADDLTFSGPRRFISALRQFIPLTEQIIRDEKFLVNKSKRRVLRQNQRMTVTGIVVNKDVNVVRRDYDLLKATLHNCIKHGPASQNRDDHPDFAAHLRGRIEYVRQLNPRRGDKLLAKFTLIRWS